MARTNNQQPATTRQATLRSRRSQQRFLRRLCFLSILGLVSATSGATVALLAATPLKHYASRHRPSHQSSMSNLVPVALTQPINILVLGIDNSGHPHAQTASLSDALAGNSDTMLLVRILPDTHQVMVLSIPRDTLVQTAKGIDKINDANMQGGATFAAQTVSQLLGGMQIDRYVRLDTEGFIHLVDAIGGVTISVPKPMSYTDHTQHLTIHFPAGPQHLTGQHLQEYVRFRHDEWGDIGRVQRQQAVLKALMQTLMQPATLAKVPQILQVVQSNVDTDLSLGEMLAIASFAHGLDLRQVNQMMLPGRFSRPGEYALSYWIEDPQATATLLAQYFGAAAVNASSTTTDAVPPEQLQIAIANATNQPELSTKAIAFLQARGFRHVYLSSHEVDTSAVDATTQVIAQRGDADAAQKVQQAIGIGQVQVAATGDLASDITIVIEPDFAAKLGAL